MKKLWSAISNGFLEIRYHVMRSILSVVGIILGVMNLTAMFSIVKGTEVANRTFIESLGSQDMVQVSVDWHKVRDLGASALKQYRLTLTDMENIKKYASTVKAVGVEISLNEMTQYKDKNKSYRTLGVSPSTFPMNKYIVVNGRPINEYDMQNAARVCVLGSTVATELFGDTDPIGKVIKIRNDYFQVIGVLTEYGATLSKGPGSSPKKSKSSGKNNNPLEWKNVRILIPVTTALDRFIGQDTSQNWLSIFVQSKSVETVTATMDEVMNIMLKTHNDQDIYSVGSVQEWMSNMEEFTAIWNIVLGVVAGISLMVGGIGIMNVMLASFRERMREIGIRKAIGASNVDIFLLFIVETIVICIIGGFIGLGFGYVVSMTALTAMLQGSFGAKPEFSFDAGVVAMAFSMFVGMLSGLYPAIKAAKLPPVEALRYE
ncbi:MAG: FtsX-like permease family protein [Brevinematales bacterium]|nr:FtsX-like permease family protein [Brevinematales bacterium]